MHTTNNPFAPEAGYELVVPAKVIRKPRRAKAIWRTRDDQPFDPSRVAKVGLVAVTEPSKPAIS